jgi:predicted  nucleic acid-binding Zn-ribbon protein
MKAETILSGLEKLYARRKALDAQISEAEKKLVGEVKNAAKTASAVKGKVAAVKKSVGRPAKKPLGK